jgi:hypothetical protein
VQHFSFGEAMTSSSTLRAASRKGYMRNKVSFDAIRMIYELSEIIWYVLPDESLQRKRIEELRKEIRREYDERVWK